MNIYFYLTHTLYAKVLIPLIVKLVDKGHNIYILKNKFDFLRYSPHLYGGNPVSNRFVNRDSFDYIATISNYSNEWKAVGNRVRFTFFFNPKESDAIIGTTKNLDALETLQKRCPTKNIFAIGYQHMPFTICLKGDFAQENLPEICMDVFMRPNPFSQIHKFSEYVSNHKVSFRGFPYLEKIYNKRSIRKIDKRYVLVFHPGGYRGVITKPGDSKEISYKRQKDFFLTICTPILNKGLVPVIKIHPLPARYHFKEDVSKILNSLSGDFSKVIIEQNDYYKYAYKSDTVVTFGSSGIYELFSIGMQDVIICDFFGSSRSRKFSFMKGIFIDSIEEYNNFWKDKKESYFLNVYRENPILNNIYKSYSTLFTGNTSELIIKDMGLA